MLEQRKLNQLLNVRYSGLLEENVFGYVQIRKPELKIKDYSIYHGFYCGLCERLRDKYGLKGSITLTYDMTFMAVFLSSLYDAENIVAEKRCIMHPAKKQKIIYNQYTDYCADMNILLSYYHCLDDKLDDGSIRGYAGTLFYDKVHKQTKRLYKRQARKISECLKKLNELEKDKDTKIFDAADCFGWLLAEIMCFKKGYFEKEVKKFWIPFRKVCIYNGCV